MVVKKCLILKIIFRRVIIRLAIILSFGLALESFEDNIMLALFLILFCVLGFEYYDKLVKGS